MSADKQRLVCSELQRELPTFSRLKIPKHKKTLTRADSVTGHSTRQHQASTMTLKGHIFSNYDSSTGGEMKVITSFFPTVDTQILPNEPLLLRGPQ